MRFPGTALLFTAVFLLTAVFPVTPVAGRQQPEPPETVSAPDDEMLHADEFMDLLLEDPPTRHKIMERIETTWQPEYVTLLLEVLPFGRDETLVDGLVDLLEKKTGQRLGRDVQGWLDWVWKKPQQLHPEYAEFKAHLYAFIDRKFERYFGRDRQAEIRLDEVRWGGVMQDGIPPLRNPKMIPAAEADYLQDRHVVFGVEIEGDVRAYPKRILAWHEMFTDTVGGVAVAGVYCTLCGTVMIYETELNGVHYELGTSGFLYRSNKLMYDRATQSLWNTLWGRPVIGPLVGQGIQLQRRSVVTTTWGEWRRRHPRTTVLSLDTGHQRDYSEGAAYRNYFATDELMFNVSQVDRRLPNKAEVLALVFPEHSDETLAVAADYLKRRPLYHDRVGKLDFVVFTDRSGANRVYATEGLRFTRWDQDRTALDIHGETWQVTEAHLLGPDGRKLERLPAQRSFWFGWYAAYPETRLVK